MSIEQYGKESVARHFARHAEADSLLFNSVGFHFDGGRWICYVRGFIVGEFRTLAEVKAFSMMHNPRISESHFT
jgi:hypothetical protein